MPQKPHSIVLISGLWMTALSRENCVTRYTEQGLRVIAWSWPGMDIDIDELRRNPEPIATLGIAEIVDHYETIIQGLASLRSLWVTPSAADDGHSPEQCQSILSGAQQPGRAVPLTPEQFHYAFANNLSEEESLDLYNRCAIPGPDNVLFSPAFANFNPHTASTVDFQSVVEANLNLYRKSNAVTEYKEFPERPHYILGQDDWEKVAEDALEWEPGHASEKASDGPSA